MTAPRMFTLCAFRLHPLTALHTPTRPVLARLIGLAPRPQTWRALFSPSFSPTSPGPPLQLQRGHIAGRCPSSATSAARRGISCGSARRRSRRSGRATAAARWTTSRRKCSEPWKDPPKECYNCGSSAHLVADCTEQWTPAPQRQSGHTVAAANEANGLTTAARVLGSFRLWSLPGITLNVGQIAGYAVFALVCIVLQAPLVENPNRAGFFALAPLPFVFIFASKNSPLTALLLGPGVDYTKLDYVHRPAVVSSSVHSCMAPFGLTTTSSGICRYSRSGKKVRASLLSAASQQHRAPAPAVLFCVLCHPLPHLPRVLHNHLLPHDVRHALDIPPIVFYAADGLLQLLRFRVAARVEPRDGGLILIHVPLATGGWRARQHLQVRAMMGGRAWEAHPLSVCCAEPGVTGLKGPDGAPFGILLAARACGDWSRALYAFALSPSDDLDDYEPASSSMGRESGATFNDLVGRCTRDGGARRGGERARRVVWCWCVRSFGAINWLAPHLLQIATAAARPRSGIQLTIRIYVTCMCDPDAVPASPRCTVTEARPRVESAGGTALPIFVFLFRVGGLERKR
ncbi:hypothetical protein B0H17DRAFT_1326798 [Mycena rosella]|uniref:CCHC-type domain-containing protein n=1 Tax=Mycena rosella TaxID=1033263 RepID=A0AAD7E2L2_MYCRO|nr:hypothetical protein B0H17DRAFT_1326798 [Mycena rosella]